MDGIVVLWFVNSNFLGIYSFVFNVIKKYEKCEIKSINGWEKNLGYIIGIFIFFNCN